MTGKARFRKIAAFLLAVCLWTGGTASLSGERRCQADEAVPEGQQEVLKQTESASSGQAEVTVKQSEDAVQQANPGTSLNAYESAPKTAGSAAPQQAGPPVSPQPGSVSAQPGSTATPQPGSTAAPQSGSAATPQPRSTAAPQSGSAATPQPDPTTTLQPGSSTSKPDSTTLQPEQPVGQTVDEAVGKSKGTPEDKDAETTESTSGQKNTRGGNEAFSPDSPDPDAEENQKETEHQTPTDEKTDPTLPSAPQPADLTDRTEDGISLSNDQIEWEDGVGTSRGRDLIDLSSGQSDSGSLKTGTINLGIMGIAEEEWQLYAKGTTKSIMPFYFSTNQKKKKKAKGSIVFAFENDHIVVTIRNTGNRWKNLRFVSPAGGSRTSDTWVTLPNLQKGGSYSFQIPLPGGAESITGNGESIQFSCSVYVKGKLVDLLTCLPVYIVPPGFPASDVPVGDPLESLGEIDAELSGKGGGKPGVARTVTVQVNTGNIMQGAVQFTGSDVVVSIRMILEQFMNGILNGLKTNHHESFIRAAGLMQVLVRALSARL